MEKITLSIVLLICSPFIVSAQFGPPQLINLPPDTPNFKQFIRTADIDSDGKTDILVASSFNEICRIFHNEGSFNFSPPTTLPGTWERLNGMEIADFNNDGKPDVTTLDSQGGKLFWHPNSEGLFPQQILIADNLEIQSTRIVCEDFNNDGNIDIFILTHFNGQLYLNDGAGNFAPPQLLLAPEDETEIYDNVAGDFNNDSFKDLAIASSGFSIYLNDGQGQFTKWVDVGTAISFLLESADYNNDGLDDILMDSNTLIPFQNSATGFSIAGAFSPNNENYQTIFSSDLDNDGDLDVISEDNQTNAFFWHENIDGGSSWVRHTISIGFNFSTIFGVRAADLDGDNDNDLIRSSSNGEVAIYENQQILNVSSFADNDFTMYPDPASNTIHIQNTTAISEIEIFDLLGKKVLSQTANEKLITANISSLKTGYYLLKVTTASGTMVKKLLVQ